MRIPVKRNVVLLGIVSFFNDVSSEMIAPLLPIFLTNVLFAGKLVSGSIMGAIESSSSLFKVVFGYISDKMQKRNRFVFAGYLISTASKAALAFVYSAYEFLLLRIADRIGKGVRTAPRDAIIAESSGESGKSFGFHRSMDTLGAVIGPILAIVLLNFLGNSISTIRLIFLLSAVPATIGIFFLLFVKDTGLGLSKAIKGISAFKNRELKIFMLAIFIASLGRYSYAFTIWRAEELGYNLVESIILYAIFNVIYSVSAYPSGLISDKVGKKFMVGVGFLLFASTSLIFAFAKSLIGFILAFSLFGISVAIEDTVPRAYASDLAKDFEKGTIIGAYHTLYGLAVFPASFILSLCWQTIGLSYGFIYAAVMNLIAIAILILLK